MVYFLTYTIVDLVDLIRNFIETGRDITKDLTGNVRDTMSDETKEIIETKKKKTVKKSFFEEKKDEPVKEKKERKPRRTESDARGLTDLTPEQLDDLLSGKPIEEVVKRPDLEPLPPIELNSNGEKKLF